MKTNDEENHCGRYDGAEETPCKVSGETRRKYIVSIPITGAIHIEVDASSPQDAERRAWGRYSEEGPEAGEVEWNAIPVLIEGNVCHAYISRISAKEVKE